MIIKISIPNRIKLKKVASLRAVFWPKEGEIHYLGGADVLPAPLSAAEETEILPQPGEATVPLTAEQPGEATVPLAEATVPLAGEATVPLDGESTVPLVTEERP